MSEVVWASNRYVEVSPAVVLVLRFDAYGELRMVSVLTARRRKVRWLERRASEFGKEHFATFHDEYKIIPKHRRVAAATEAYLIGTVRTYSSILN